MMMAAAEQNLNPFNLLPEEIWDLILDKLDDSKDAWNLFKAFPELDLNPTLQKKKHFWLFGLVIRHIILNHREGWITGQDLLQCRLACKRWSTAVDTFLENQPQLKLPHPGSGDEIIGTGDIFPPAVGGTTLRFPRLSGSPHRPSKFFPAMELHPPERSPFISRMLRVTFCYTLVLDEDDLDEATLPDCRLYEQFGGHVWYYRLAWRFPLRGLGIRYITLNLMYLPNLRLLDLDGNPNEHVSSDMLKNLERELPTLPYLEMLCIVKCPRQLVDLLFNRYGTQVRRLQLECNLLRQKYSQLFPNLQEFGILCNTGYEGEGEIIEDIFTSTVAPSLSKLQLSFGGTRKDTFVIEDFFRWLKRFPNLNCFNLFCAGPCSREFRETGTLSVGIDSLPALQYLSISTSCYLTYDFLRCLPSLRHLQLHVDSRPVVTDQSTHPVVKIREEIQTATLYQSNIWELLPKLKTVFLTFGNFYCKRKYTFTREGLEYQRKSESQVSAV